MNRKRSLILSAVVAGTAFAGGAAFAATTFVASPTPAAQPVNEVLAGGSDVTSAEGAPRPTWVLLQEPAPELPNTPTVAPAEQQASVAVVEEASSDDFTQPAAEVSFAGHREHDDDEEEEREHEDEHDEEHEDEEEHENGDD